MKTIIGSLIVSSLVLAQISIAQWVQTNGPYGGSVSCFAVSPNEAGGTNLFAGTYGGGVFLSTNNGTSWTAVRTGLTGADIYALVVSPASGGAGSANLFAGTSGGLFLSTDNGTSWTEVNSGSYRLSALAVSGTNLLAGTDGGGVFLSTNNGTNWTPVNTGLTNTYIYSLAVSGTNLFAGTGGSGVWRRPLSEMTGVVQRHSDAPTQFTLHQNYPNPFNPSTTIEYQIPKQSLVAMKIFDLLGRQVATLVNEKQGAGTYSVQWNATGFSSGVYFYRLEANERKEIKKLILMK
jgi:hypothetical protein